MAKVMVFSLKNGALQYTYEILYTNSELAVLLWKSFA